MFILFCISFERQYISDASKSISRTDSIFKTVQWTAVDVILYTGIGRENNFKFFIHVLQLLLNFMFFTFKILLWLRQYRDVYNDQWGFSHFNWTLDSGANYHILRTGTNYNLIFIYIIQVALLDILFLIGCYPYMKYHCTKRPLQDLSFDDNFIKLIKVLNLGKLNWKFIISSSLWSQYITDYEMQFLLKGIPQLMYGLSAIMLLRFGKNAHVEYVDMREHGKVPIYFLYKEDKGSHY